MDYEVRLDFEDETFEIVTIPANNYGEAIAIAKRDPEVVHATVLGTIDHEPYSPLI